MSLLLAKGFCPSGVGQVHLHAKGVGEDPGAWGHGGFWPLLLGTGALASRLLSTSAGPWPLLPGVGGLGLNPLSLQRWLVGWDDMPCRVTCAVDWSQHLRPRSPEIHGCSHMVASLVPFRKRSCRGVVGTLEESGVQPVRGYKPPTLPPALAGSFCPLWRARSRLASSPASGGDSSAGTEQLFEPIPVLLGPPECVSKHSRSPLAYFSAHCPDQ